MNLTIKQSTTSTENLSSPLIVETLYQLTKPDSTYGLPTADAVLVGRIQVPAAYEDAVDFLNTQFSAANSDNGSDFQITVLNNNYYIRFADTEAERVLKSNMGKGEGEGITVAEAATKRLPTNLFYNNTTIETFDEFKYFKQNDDGGAIVRNCTNLTSIDLTNLIKLPNWLCGGCTSLTHFHGINGPEHTLNLVNLAQTVNNNAGCFNGCLGLKYVTSLGAIPYLNAVFQDCTNLETVVLPITCSALYGNAFKNCTKLSTINLSHLTTISNSEFEGDYSLEYCDGEGSTQGVLYLPNLTSTLGNSAFKGCAKLTSVTSLGSITSIGDSTFENCVNLATINITNTVTSIGAVAFNNTAWLNNQPSGPVYINNVLYKYKADSATSYTAPSNVTYITAQAFKECTNLTSVDLSNLSITALGNNTFESCENLQTAVLPNTITSLGGNLFYRCYNLQTVNIPSGVTTLKDGLFRSCNKLQSVTIPNSATKIERLVFSGCDLLSIHIPALVTSFDVGFYSTFSGNKNCTVITVDSNNTKYDSRDNCNAIIETANNKLVWGCAGTVIPSSVTSIGDYAFQSMLGTAVTAFTIPSNVDTIGSRVFDNCVGLVSLTVERTTPPSVGTELFFGKNMSVPNIYVPRDSVTAYKTASGWSSYASKIQAIPTT